VKPQLTTSVGTDAQDDNSFTQTNLVSDGFVTAANTDTNLVNPWGIAASATGPFWIADNGTGLTTFYDGAGTPKTVLGQSSITIAAPPGQTTAASPTGEVFNSERSGFDISSGGKTGPSIFLFATEDGTISGWNPGVNAASTVIAVDNSNGGAGAVYKGLALADVHGREFLYAANFRNGTVDVFNSHFKEVKSFTDPNLPKGYAPFNVAVLDGHLFVTYALQNDAKHDDVAGPGHGFIDEFSLSGHLERRVDSHFALNSPWGMAIAPQGFGDFGGDLLVGNFGDGTIDVFNPNTDVFLGKLDGPDGKPIVIDGLWSLMPGNGGPNSDPNSIYFTAGIDDEKHGLFGKLTTTPDGAGASMQAGADTGQSFMNLLHSTASFGATASGSAGDGASAAAQATMNDAGLLAAGTQAHAGS
jgi:uncharacterized protein (TIGR03118 family)